MPADAAVDPEVILGVSGGIAAYKAADLLRRLTESGHQVRVVPTEAALHFVGAATWAALSGHPVATDVWSGVEGVPHVRLGRAARLIVVAPASADLLSRAATGRADDLLTATLLTARCPVLYAPAMHTEMWDHPATQANVAILRERGAVVLEPAIGRLTGPDTGKGRFPDPQSIAAIALQLLSRGSAVPDLAGRKVVVSAGGTREHLDPVRFLGNASSGKQGYAFAAAAVARGASVTVVAANVGLPEPAGAQIVHVTSTDQLRDAVVAAAHEADAVVMAAAPADFRPVDYSAAKIKKTGAEPEPLKLTTTPDVAAELGAHKSPGQLLVVFAAETGGPDGGALERARAKLSAKHGDLIVLNDVSEGRVFGADENTATILAADGAMVDFPRGSKGQLADRVWDLVVERWR